jgi:tRNA threonylcarbamoyladenosine biosynthesis protein TsaE
MMDTYTLKMDSCGDISLLSTEGIVYPLTRLLALAQGNRVFAFNGPMGAGKTTLITQLCRALGTNDVVNSPTFALVNVYEIPHPDGTAGMEEIYHFDCYRLRNLHEALDMGAEEYLCSGCLCFIEWPDILRPILPDGTIWLTLRVLPDGTRTLIVGNPPD